MSGMWFRNPKKDIVEALPYSFWVKEMISSCKVHYHSLLTDSNYWDIRFWIGLIVSSILLLFIPITTFILKKDRLSDIEKGNGLSLFNDSNITKYKQLTKSTS